MTMNPSGAALFSEDRRYRYLLRRRVGPSPRSVLFIMLNPSQADEERDDPTIRRCVGFARGWGYGRLEVVNLFGLMSTDPKVLLQTEDPIGPDNDAEIRKALANSDRVVLAWGNHGLRHGKRVADVIDLTRNHSRPYCLGLTKRGAPRHPVRLPANTVLTPF